MPRSTPEWIGKTDDSRPPPRVLLRIFRANNGICHISGRKIQPGEKWHAEHVIALINGGANRESNLRPALLEPHKVKTAADLAEKAKVDAIAKRHIGAKPPAKRPIQSASFPGKKQRQARPALPRRNLYERISIK